MKKSSKNILTLFSKQGIMNIQTEKTNGELYYGT